MANFDTVLQGGTVVDPGLGTHEGLSVGIKDGRIAAIDNSIVPSAGSEVIDASGLLVTPGLIDLHVHSYAGVSHISFDADSYCVENAVTTAVDAGSSGVVTFPGFRRYIASKSRTRMLAFVHVAMYGATRDPGELLNLDAADVEGTAATIRANRDIAVGVKVRVAGHHVGEHGNEALELARAAGEASQTPVMVHIGHSTIGMTEIVGHLRAGDVVTHCFTPQDPTILDRDGTLMTSVAEAYDRGVLFDVGPCDVDFDLGIARQAIREGRPPQTISTDAYVIRFPRRRLRENELVADTRSDTAHGPQAEELRPAVDNLPTMMSVFMALGLTLEDVVRCSTSNPASAIGWQDRIGYLEVGREADISILELRKSPMTFHDSSGQSISIQQRLIPRFSSRSGIFVSAKAVP